MAAALARAEMRAEHPSVKVVSRAQRSLKKKIARIAELESMRDSGRNLSADQVKQFFLEGSALWLKPDSLLLTSSACGICEFPD